MYGREVHGVPHHPIAQEIADRGRRFDPHQLLRLFGGRGDVRGRDDLRQLGERPIGRRFGFEHIETGAADQSFLDRAPKGPFVDQLAARGIDEADAGLAARKAVVIEEVPRFRRRRQVQRQVIGVRADFVESHELDAQARRDLLGNVRIVGDDAHAEGTGAPGDFLADSSQPGHAERLPAHFRAEKALLLPFSGLHGAVGGGNRPRERQHQRACVLGDADAVGAGRVDDQDAAGAGAGHVDVVDAGPGARDDAEPRRRVHQGRGHLGCAADENAVGVRHIQRERVRLASGARVHHPTGLCSE